MGGKAAFESCVRFVVTLQPYEWRSLPDVVALVLNTIQGTSPAPEKIPDEAHKGR